MERHKDYYRILGVPRNASTSAIERAYRRLSRKLGPARPSAPADAEFADVQAAYHTLADAERRRRYDESLGKAEPGRKAASGWSLLRGPVAPGELRRPRVPVTLTGEVVLGAGEAAGGGNMALDMPISTECDACAGTGGTGFTCEACEGEGKIERRLPLPVRIPKGVKDGTVFQVSVDDPAVRTVLITVHVRPS
jgi:DnaJ-class molecular chaperone